MTIESIVDGMSDDEAEYFGRWYAIMRIHHEGGLQAQRVLLAADMLDSADRLFFNRKERRQLTKGM